MKKTAIALCLIISVAVSAAPIEAYCPPGPHHHRPPRPHYYYDYDYYYGAYDDVALSCGIGILLGTIVANNNANEQAKQQERAQKLESVRNRCKDAVSTEIQHVAELIQGTGLANTLDFLQKYWNAKAMRTFTEDRNNIAVLTITGFDDNVKVEYTFMKEYKEVTVKASSVEYKISEEKKAYYKEPEPRSELNSALGMDLSNDLRSPAGYLLAQNVVNGTAASFAGIFPGDSIIRIDAYDTKNIDVSRIIAYITARAKAKAAIKVTFIHNGKKKTSEIQM